MFEHNKSGHSSTRPEQNANNAAKRTVFSSFLPGDLLFLPFFAIMLAPLLEFIRRYPDINSLTFHAFPLVVYFLMFAGVMGIAEICLYGKKRKEIGRKKTRQRNVPMLFFGFTMAMMLLSTMVNGFTPLALYGDAYRRESLFSYLAYFTILFLGATFIQSQQKKSILLGTFLCSSIVLALRELVVYAITAVTGTRLYGDIITSVFEQFNHYGYYLAMAAVISCALVRSDSKLLRYLAVVGFLTNSAALVINDTFGAFLGCWAGLIFAVIVFSICSKKLDRTAIGMLILFIVIIMLTNYVTGTVSKNFSQLSVDVGKITTGAKDAKSAGTGRWGIVKATLSYIPERPLLGFGVEGIAERLLLDTARDRPHCEYLQYAAFFGIPAAISYVIGVFCVFLNGLKHRYALDLYTKTALVAAFAYLVSAAFGNTMYNTAPYLFILLGLGYYRDPSA